MQHQRSTLSPLCATTSASRVRSLPVTQSGSWRKMRGDRVSGGDYCAISQLTSRPRPRDSILIYFSFLVPKLPSFVQSHRTHWKTHREGFDLARIQTRIHCPIGTHHHASFRGLQPRVRRRGRGRHVSVLPWDDSGCGLVLVRTTPCSAKQREPQFALLTGQRLRI